jgi:hypothetical protein
VRRLTRQIRVAGGILIRSDMLELAWSCISHLNFRISTVAFCSSKRAPTCRSESIFPLLLESVYIDSERHVGARLELQNATVEMRKLRWETWRAEVASIIDGYVDVVCDVGAFEASRGQTNMDATSALQVSHLNFRICFMLLSRFPYYLVHNISFLFLFHSYFYL